MAKLTIFQPGIGNVWDDSGCYGYDMMGIALTNDISVDTAFNKWLLGWYAN